MPDLQTILQLLKANPRAMGPNGGQIPVQDLQQMYGGNRFGMMGPNGGQIPVQDLQQLFGTRGSDQ